MTTVKQKFFNLCQEEIDSKQFTLFMQENCKRNSSFNLGESLQELNKEESKQLWCGVLNICNAVLGNFHFQLVESDFRDEEINDRNSAIECLQEVTKLVCTALELKAKDNEIEQSLHEITAILHGIILSLPTSAATLQDHICDICEIWWCNELNGKEEFIPHMAPYLLMKCLEPQSHLKDIKRLWSIRSCLLLLDYDDPSAKSTKLLILRCYMHPLFLKTDEADSNIKGRRILTYMFGLHVPLIEEIHATIKNNIPSSSRSFQERYGEIYFRAWRSSSGLYRAKIENFCIQDLMHHAIHARVAKPSITAGLKRILDQFHHEKKQKGVDEMLQRLYQPIIWRSVKVANGLVRANAAALLFSAFPLHDPDSKNEEIDTSMQRQFDTFSELLLDPCPNVREVTVKGVCRAISVFWELIPVAVLNSLLNKLVNQLANDGASANVRCAVIKGLSFVLDNHLSLPSLKALLPKLSNHIHDVSERVRIAFIDLLILVKGSIGIKFWEIVTIEHLLARMEIDTEEVTKKIVELLFNSFVPLTKDEDIQITRCVTLVRTNQNAARRFYQFAHCYMSVTATGKYIILICRYLLSCIGSDQQPKDDDTKENRKNINIENLEDDENDQSDDVTLSEASTIQGLLEAIAILWAQIYDELNKPLNENIHNRLISKFEKAAPTFYRIFKNGHTFAATVTIAGYLPETKISNLSTRCYQNFTSLPNDAVEKDFDYFVSSLCMWGKCDSILEQVTAWLRCESYDRDERLISDRPIRKKRSKLSQPRLTENRSQLALRVLNFLMDDRKCRPCLLACTVGVKTALENLKNIINRLEDTLKFSETKPTVNQEQSEDWLGCVIKVYYQLVMHTTLQELNKSDGHLQLRIELCNLLDWTRQVITPTITSLKRSNTNVETQCKKRTNFSETDDLKLELAKNIITSTMTILHDALLVVPADVRLTGDIIRLIRYTLEEDFSDNQIVLLAIKVFGHIACQSLYSYVNGDTGYMDTFSNHDVLDVVKALLQKSLMLSEEPPIKISLNLTGAISELIWSMARMQFIVNLPDINFMRLLADVTIEGTAKHLKKLCDENKLKNLEVDQLAHVTGAIINTLLKNSSIEGSYVAEISHEARINGAGIWRSAAVLQILMRLGKGNSNSSTTKSYCIQAIENYIDGLDADELIDSHLMQELIDVVAKTKQTLT